MKLLKHKEHVKEVVLFLVVLLIEKISISYLRVTVLFYVKQKRLIKKKKKNNKKKKKESNESAKEIKDQKYESQTGKLSSENKYTAFTRNSSNLYTNDLFYLLYGDYHHE